MKILTICHEYPPVGGGGATACRILAEALVRAGHVVDVVTSGMRDLPRLEVSSGVTIHRTACVRRLRHYSTTAELASWILPALATGNGLLRQHKYDLVHCHFVVPGGIVASALARRARVPFVLTAHGSDVPGYNPDRFALVHRLISPLWSRIVWASAAVTVPSRHLCELMAKHTPHPIHVIANPFDVPAPRSVERTDRILVATRLVERKGVQTLLAALANSAANYEVVVVGDGPYLSTLKRLAAEGAVPVRFLGFVPREQLSEHYAASRVFVFPSIQENFPMVLLEAMAHGCAVLTTSARGCAEVVGDAALLVPPGDVARLRESVVLLMSDDALAAELARRGKERVQQFASARIAGEFERLFESMLGRDQASAT
jgi:glycosyltransferase involved in cell wall biosynthesis